MKTKTFTPAQWGGALSRPLLLFLLSFTLTLTGCEKPKDIAEPLSTSQAYDVRVDDNYKRDKTGQYVSKNVQVTGYEDGSERPTRPKFDVAGAVGALTIPPDVPCPYSTDCTGNGGGGSYPPPVQSGFVSSEGIGYAVYPNQFHYNPYNYIQDLKIIKGSSPSIGTGDFPGYFKIDVDLNRGAGGKHIYLCFTRNPDMVVGSRVNPGAWVNDARIGRTVPVRGIDVKTQTFGPANQWPDSWTPPIEAKDALGFHCPDLNDGAGGKYIYAYQRKDSFDNSLQIVREVGVLYGNSSSIQPPPGWERIPGDLNQGAGGDYIYFCVKF